MITSEHGEKYIQKKSEKNLQHKVVHGAKTSVSNFLKIKHETEKIQKNF